MNIALNVTSSSVHKRVVRIGAALAVTAFVAACGTMPATRTDFLAQSPPLTLNDDRSEAHFRAPVVIDTARIRLDAVEWRAGDALDPAERDALTARLRRELMVAVQKSPATAGGRPVRLRAAVTRVETVSTAANVASTLLLLAPVDRGGAAVELQALDAETGEPLAVMSTAHFTPMSQIGARFSRLASAELAVKRAAEQFAALVVQTPAGVTVARQ